jgi:signal transduction histidine kinase/DNA-binding response OmpR family regulator
VSFRLRFWLIYELIDFPFAATVPLAFAAMIGLKAGSEEAWAVARVLVVAYAVKTLIWTSLMLRLLHPVEVYLQKKKKSEHITDAELVKGATAAYRYSYRFTPLYALLWGGQYLALFLDDSALPLVRSSGAGTWIFSAALLLASGVLNTSINGFLLGPVAGQISLDAIERRVDIQAPSSSFRRLLVVIALFLTLAPIGWMGSAGYVFDIRGNDSDRIHDARHAADEMALHLVRGHGHGGPLPVEALQRAVASSGHVGAFALSRNGTALGAAMDAAKVNVLATVPGSGGLVESEEEQRATAWQRVNDEWIVGAVVSTAPQPSAAFIFTILFYFVIALVFAPVVAVFIGAGVAGPVSRIAATLQSIVARGEVAGIARLPIPTRDEIGDLANSANQMIDKLERYAAANRQQLTELAEKNEQLVAAAKMKSQFLASMSHELRTPLNAIIGFSRMVMKKTDGMIPQQQTRNLKLINESGQALLALVNDLLDFERIEAGRFKLVEGDVDCVELAQNLQDTLRPPAEARGLTLDVKVVDAPLRLRTDPDRLRQVIVNFINNAIKYSEKGHIEVTFARAPTTAGVREVRISVKDQGLGIPKDQLVKVFEPFHQVDGSYAREKEGVGLGLAIVKRLADLLGGSIELDSEVGVGSTFTLVMPLRTLVERRAVDRVLPPAGHGPVILVIDDEIQTLEIMRSELAEAGYRVHVASSGHEGLERASELKPDFIVLDVQMPEMDGLTVLAKLRADAALKETPVVIASVRDEQQKDLAVSGWMTKPLDVKAFKALLEGLPKREVRDALIVEDDVATRSLIEQHIAALGLRVRCAGSAEDGLKLLEDRVPDVLVVDITLPGKDGTRVLDKMRKLGERGKQSVAVVFTAKDLSPADNTLITDTLGASLVKKQGQAGIDAVLGIVKSKLGIVSGENSGSFPRPTRPTT